MMCWMPQIPGDGSVAQGGNCLGMVRRCGHFPCWARVMVLEAALRRVSSEEGERSWGITTKPSLERVVWMSSEGLVIDPIFAYACLVW